MLDTSVLISGTIWPRWPYEVLQAGLRGEYQLVVAPVLIAEAMEKFQQRFPRHLADFEIVLQAVSFEFVENPTGEQILECRDMMTDIKDIPIALAAINGGVDYFVSEDKHFTERTDLNAALHEQLNVMLSGTFLRVVMGWESEDLEAVRGRKWSDLR